MMSDNKKESMALRSSFTPIKKEYETCEALARTPTRSQSRGQVHSSASKLGSARSRGQNNTKSKDDFSENAESPRSTTNSNQENEGRSLNELTTPRNKLSLGRVRRSTRLSSYTSMSTINEAAKSVKCTIRRAQDSTPSSATRMQPLREAASYRRPLYNLDTSSDDESTPSRKNNTPKRPKRRNASYFSKEDLGDYLPEGDIESESSEDEDDVKKNEISGSEEGEEEEERNSESESEDEDPNPEETPIRKKFLDTPTLAKMVLTPDLLKKVEGRPLKRRLAVDSPVAAASQAMSPNPETYFLAETRVKYRKEAKKKETVMNDSAKGKRRNRKQPIDREDNLPERLPSNFSVTTEAIRAAVDSKDFISGSTHDEEVDRILNNIIETEFPHWMGLFKDDFNVMIYGYGSKVDVFQHFEKFINENHLVVSINGLFPKLNPRKLLYGIYEYVNPIERVKRGSNIEAVARDAVRVLKNETHPDIFLLIRNFDNMALRAPQLLSVICILAEVPYIHLLAACDSVNAFLGVTQSQALQLRFCWLHCPTYKQYREEMKWIPGIYGGEAKIATQKSSLKYVLQSLTGNARKAFALLGQMQLKQMKAHAAKKSKDVYAGVRFQELAKDCREKFIAHSDENLRTLLVEFFDHKLIRQTAKGRHIENTLLIELDIETLEEVISEFS